MTPTLKDNLNQMYDNNPGLTRSKYNFDDPLDLLLVQHDSQHFIFGCGTDSEGEIALQISIFLLTDLSPLQIFKMYTKEEKDTNVKLEAKAALNGLFQTFGKLSFGDKIKTIFRLIGHFFNCLWIKIATRQRFPFTKTHEYLDWTIPDIRKKFNIKPYIQH
jgi:hypothetical protein